MESIHDSSGPYALLSQRVYAWAKDQPAILAVLTIGSRARQIKPADEWSDLDLILFTRDPEPYRKSSGWLQQIGDVLLTVLDSTGRGDPEWLVLFFDGSKGDFAFAQAPEPVNREPSLQELLSATADYQDVYQHGIYCLLDNTNPANEGLSIPWDPIPLTHPIQTNVLDCINHFWMDALRAAKFLRRGDLWRAFHTCNGIMKQQILQMAEWHARAQHGLEYNTWYGGRYLDEWADARLVQQLPAAFGGYNQSQLETALWNTIMMFTWLAQETATLLSLIYPIQVETKMIKLIRTTIDSEG